MKYKTLEYWEDLQDKNHPYYAGDEYPRKGLKPTQKRIKELLSAENRRGVPLIAKAEE